MTFMKLPQQVMIDGVDITDEIDFEKPATAMFIERKVEQMFDIGNALYSAFNGDNISVIRIRDLIVLHDAIATEYANNLTIDRHPARPTASESETVECKTTVNGRTSYVLYPEKFEHRPEARYRQFYFEEKEGQEGPIKSLTSRGIHNAVHINFVLQNGNTFVISMYTDDGTPREELYFAKFAKVPSFKMYEVDSEHEKYVSNEERPSEIKLTPYDVKEDDDVDIVWNVEKRWIAGVSDLHRIDGPAQIKYRFAFKTGNIQGYVDNKWYFLGRSMPSVDYFIRYIEEWEETHGISVLSTKQKAVLMLEKQ